MSTLSLILIAVFALAFMVLVALAGVAVCEWATAQAGSDDGEGN